MFRIERTHGVEGHKRLQKITIIIAFVLRFFVFLHKISGYNAILISTIVDLRREAGDYRGYNAILISTIVDFQHFGFRAGLGYNAILISTIVDVT